MIAARVPNHTHSILNMLVSMGRFETKSDAIRAAMDIGLTELKRYCPSLREFTTHIRDFDKAYWSVMNNKEKVIALVQEIDDIAAPLIDTGLAWTLFDIEKMGSVYLVIARRDIADDIWQAIDTDNHCQV